MSTDVPAEEIRKDAFDLKPVDLERFPIWEFLYMDEPDPAPDEEDMLRPRPDLKHVDSARRTFLVRAELLTSDGMKYVGCVIPRTEEKIRSIHPGIGSVHPALFHPTIVTERGTVSFWFGGLPTLAADYR
jgi:hypothetical protein